MCLADGHKIRKLMAEMDSGDMFGQVEVDETYVGGKHKGKRGRGAEGKTVVFGMKERVGDLKTEVVQNVKRKTLEPIVLETIEEGSIVYSDELKTYDNLNSHGYYHDTVQHGIGEYVNGECHVNSLEGTGLYSNGVFGAHMSTYRNGTCPSIYQSLTSGITNEKHRKKCLVIWSSFYGRNGLPE